MPLRSRTEVPVEVSPEVRVAVDGVVEPLSGRTLGELGLVDHATHTSSGLHVALAGLGDDSAYAERLVEGVRTACGRGTEVEVRVADDERRHAVAARLRPSHHRPGTLGSTTRIYAVASGKGGVGKSTVTANLAAELASSGLRVGLVDADVWGYSQTVLFGVRRAPVAVSGLMFPVDAHGVQLMSVGFFVDDGEPVIWRGPMLHKALEQFLDDVYWGALDVLLVDLPPGTGDVTLSVLELLPDAAMIVVTTPQPAAESVAARVGLMARGARMQVAGVVENMAGGAFGAGGGARLAGVLGAPLLGSVPLDPDLCEAGDAGLPLVLSAPRHPAALALRDIAAGLPAVRPSLVGRQLPLFVSDT